MKEANYEFVPPLFDRPGFVAQMENGMNNYALILNEVNTKSCVAAAMYETNYRGQKDTVYLTFFRVAPNHRNLGIGLWFRQRLLKHLQVEGFKLVVTRTWSTNSEMIKLIEKTGFSPTKTIKDDRGPGIHT